MFNFPIIMIGNYSLEITMVNFTLMNLLSPLIVNMEIFLEKFRIFKRKYYFRWNR